MIKKGGGRNREREEKEEKKKIWQKNPERTWSLL